MGRELHPSQPLWLFELLLDRSSRLDRQLLVTPVVSWDTGLDSVHLSTSREDSRDSSSQLSSSSDMRAESSGRVLAIHVICLVIDRGIAPRSSSSSSLMVEVRGSSRGAEAEGSTSRAVVVVDSVAVVRVSAEVEAVMGRDRRV